MDALVIDLTHGGVQIAVELQKLSQFDNIYAFDIYNTLKDDEKQKLDSYNIDIFFNEENIKNLINDILTDKSNNFNKSKNKELLVINPVHSPFDISNTLDIDNETNNKNNISIREITHHQAINLILKNWKEKLKSENIPIIEVTGVKGKTSVVAMLKEIFIDKNPLVLSSLGANLYKNDKKIVLKKNISITPASILETVKLAKRIANPDCVNIGELKIDGSSEFSGFDKSDFNLCYNACIFESSLGATGLGNVGVLTNIVENYPIAKNTSNARDAKEQIFNCDIVTIEKETLEEYYSQNKDNCKIYNISNIYNICNNIYNINTFSFNDKNANLFVDNVQFGLNNTKIRISYNNIKTQSGELIDGNLDIDTFAPGKHHVLNVLASITVALSLNIDKNIIETKLSNFKGIKGRTSLKTNDGLVIIEEINPGINTKAIESSINMINDLNNYVVIIGGKYGVTCEEIDEDKVAALLDNILDNILDDNEYAVDSFENTFNLILTDDLGKEIQKKMKNKVKFVKDPFEAQNLANTNKKNVLFIYRSNYSQINKR